MSTVAAAKRGPYAASRRRRDSISTAVMELVDELGHDNVTTALVATRAATSEATVLYHFPTKDHLLVAALERADDITLEKAGPIDDETRLDLDWLKASASGLVDGSEQLSRLLVMLRGQSATPGHPAVDYFQRRIERTLEIYTALISRRQAEGFAHPSLDPRDVATQLMGLWDGLTSMWVVDRHVDIGSLVVSGYQRLAGEDWMQASKNFISSFPS